MNAHTHSSPVRVPFAGVVALIATSLLFLMMKQLIEEEVDVAPPTKPIPITYLPTVDDEPLTVRPPRVQPPPAVEPPPPTTPRIEDPSIEKTWSGEQTRPPARERPTVSRAAIADGQALPIVKVEPRYPERALARGISGHVLLSLTIGPTGAVTDVAVVEAVPTGVFEASAVAAAKRFKYRPKVVEGRAVEQTDVLNLIRFDLPAQGTR